MFRATRTYFNIFAAMVHGPGDLAVAPVDVPARLGIHVVHLILDPFHIASAVRQGEMSRDGWTCWDEL